jgi:hypothetical protein
MELSAIVGFISLCNAALQLGKSLRSDSLSTDEERLLEAACHDGVIELVRSDSFLTVYAGQRLYNKDRTECIRYLSAFQKLCERRYLLPEGDTRFTLSADALEVGRRHAEEHKTLEPGAYSMTYVPYLTKDEQAFFEMATHAPEFPVFAFSLTNLGWMLRVAGTPVLAGGNISGRSVQLVTNLKERGFVTNLGCDNSFILTSRGYDVLASLASVLGV